MMKRYKLKGLLLLLTISLTFCAMKQELQTTFPQEIQTVFYQKEKLEKRSEGIHFYIEFKKPLDKSIALKKIYFLHYQGSVQKITPQNYKVALVPSDTINDLILDMDPTKEYGNKAPVIAKARFDIKPTETVLEYELKNKTYYLKISKVFEKSL